jgi:hypothetical protein
VTECALIGDGFVFGESAIPIVHDQLYTAQVALVLGKVARQVKAETH